MIPGARILKTGIAVSITMFLCKLLRLEPALFGAVSAVINLQPSIRLTLSTAREQLIVHLLGIIIAFIVGFTLGASPLTMGLVVVLIIWIYSRLKLQQGVLMGIVAAIFVMSSAPNQFVDHAVSRTAVILIGLLVALSVNLLVFRPRYRKVLQDKLREASIENVKFFVASVKAFTDADENHFETCRARYDNLLGLNEHCVRLAKLHSQEEFPLRNQQGEENTGAITRFIEYNRELIEKGWEICEIGKLRNRRRSEHGDPPLSQEFRDIISLLLCSCETVERVNEKLRKKICDGIRVETEPFSEGLWEQLKDMVDQWQHRNDGSYYFHALLDLSVVVVNIRWAARQGKELLNKEEPSF